MELHDYQTQEEFHLYQECMLALVTKSLEELRNQKTNFYALFNRLMLRPNVLLKTEYVAVLIRAINEHEVRLAMKEEGNENEGA